MLTGMVGWRRGGLSLVTLMADLIALDRGARRSTVVAVGIFVEVAEALQPRLEHAGKGDPRFARGKWTLMLSYAKDDCISELRVIRSPASRSQQPPRRVTCSSRVSNSENAVSEALPSSSIVNRGPIRDGGAMPPMVLSGTKGPLGSRATTSTLASYWRTHGRCRSASVVIGPCSVVGSC